jgi:hypothetical protein
MWLLVSLLGLFEAVSTASTTAECVIWIGQNDSVTQHFLHEFAPVAKRLSASSVHFTPHYVLSQCSHCKATGFIETEPGCYSNGRYCPASFNKSNGGTVEPELQEVLRQICVFNLYGEGLWWDYIAAYSQLCADSVSDCYYRALEEASISPAKIESCISQSYKGDIRESENSLLKSEYEALPQIDIKQSPTVLLNGEPLECSGDVDCITDQICIVLSLDIKDCSDADEENNNTFKSSFLIVLIIVSVIGLAFGRMYRRPYVSMPAITPIETDSELKQFISPR